MRLTSYFSIFSALFIGAVCLLPETSKAVTSAINGDGRGGGDVVFCNANPQVSRYNGLYTLDYLLTRNDDLNENQDEYFKFGNLKGNSKDIVLSIAKKLEELSPAAANSLRSFMTRVEMDDWTHDPASSSTDLFRVWVPAPRLMEYQDEDFITDLPANCYNEKHERNISQIVLREDVNSTIIYHYNRQLFTELKATPLQMSYLLIHEWLRDYTVHASILQRVNAYMHSNDFFKAQGYENASAIKRMGLLFDRDASREPVVQLMDFDTGVNSNGSSGRLIVTVKVKNITYHKYVAIYYSLDGGEWTELPASYDKPLSYGFEQWTVNTDFARSGSTVVFAIKYVVGGQIYWDNNDYKNYTGVFRYPTTRPRDLAR